MICRGHIRASKGTFQFFSGWHFYDKLTFKSNFALWSSFQVKFERVVNGLGGQKSSQGSIYVWSNGIQCKNRKNFLLEGHRSEKDVLFWVQNIKVPFGIGHPPPKHEIQSICVQEGSGVSNLQTELNYLDLFESYCNSFDLGFLGSGGWGRWVGVSGVNNYSLYEFRRGATLRGWGVNIRFCKNFKKKLHEI